MASRLAAGSLLTAVFASNIAQRVILTDATKAGAVCLDGSPPVLYIKPDAETTKFVILQRGGGWCSSDEDCANRSKTNLGSSLTFPASIDLNVATAPGTVYEQPWGQLVNDPVTNPMMWNWTKVFLPYCDGGSLIGNLNDPVVVGADTIYYRGARIREAVQDYLLTHAGLSAASEVVLAGGSAGALATYLHADAWAAAMPPAAKVVALPDSGFFLDFDAPGRSQGFHDIMLWVLQAMNGTGALPAACRASYPGNVSACMFAQNVAPTLKTPTFALQSTYDAYQISAELHADPNNPGNYSIINAYGGQLGGLVRSRLLNASMHHGVFLDSCLHHTRYWGNITIDGDVQATAFASWYSQLGVSGHGAMHGGGAGGKRAWVQGQTFPCAQCCHNGQAL